MTRNCVGVVTVTYNSAGVLPDFLRCLSAQTYTDFILYAIDNASRDKTLEILRALGDSRLVVVANENNRGVAEGNNQGIRKAIEAGCSTVLLLNNDTEFEEAMIAQLLAGLEQSQCDMICPKILYFDEPDRIWAAGGYFQPRLGYRALHYGLDQIDRGQFEQSRLVTYTPTCCVLIRSGVFGKIGLMDPRYFAYVDDTDFMYRALMAGFTLFYLPNIRLLHKVGRLTGGAESPFSIRYTARNLTIFSLKHFGSIRASFWIFTRRVYYLVKMLTFKDSLATFKMKQNAVTEAFHMLKDDL